MKKMFKKGQEKSNKEASIAILILLIALFILAYIVFLPEKSREALLEGNQEFDYSFKGTGTEGASQSLPTNIFLKESPGIVGKSRPSAMEKDIGAFTLNTETDTFSESLATVVEVNRNVFSNNYQLLRFDLEDVGKVAEVDLLFFVKESKGRLRIAVNNHVLFFGVPGESEVVLKVPVERLKNSNQLEISTDIPKPYVWETNAYVLEDAKLVKKILKDNRIFSKIFSVSEAEIAGMSKAFVDYFVYCNVEDGGMLKVFINNELMFADQDLCDKDKPKTEIPKDVLRPGKNNIKFEVDKGNYRLEEAVVSGDLSDSYKTKYSFKVPEATFNSLKSGKDLKLLFKFPDDKRRRTMILTLNAHQINIDTTQNKYEKVVDNYIRLGENVLTLIPRTNVEILDMEVRLG